jgi:molybdopterin converting factor small subunit
MNLPISDCNKQPPNEGAPVEVTVNCFGIWRDLVGSRSVAVTLPTGCTVTGLVAYLSSRYGAEFQQWLINPANGELWSSFAIAVNDSLIDRAADLVQELHTGDRVSFFHQVTGGT